MAVLAYLIKTISLFVILTGIAVLTFFGFASLLVFLVLHQLGSYDFFPYSLGLAIDMGLRVAVVFVQRIGAELMTFPYTEFKASSMAATPAGRPYNPIWSRLHACQASCLSDSMPPVWLENHLCTVLGCLACEATKNLQSMRQCRT